MSSDVSMNGPAFLLLSVALVGCDRRHQNAFAKEGASCADDATCGEAMACLKGVCVTKDVFEAEGRCRASAECRTEGKCAATIAGVMVPRSAAMGCFPELEGHCAHADVCASTGDCAISGDGFLRKCAPSTTAQCAASRACADTDACFLVEDTFGRRCARAYEVSGEGLPRALELPEPIGSYETGTVDPSVWSAARTPDEHPKVGLFCQMEKKDDFDVVVFALDRRKYLRLAWKDDQRAAAFALPLVVDGGARLAFSFSDVELADRDPSAFVATTMKGDAASVTGEGVTVRCIRTSRDQAIQLAQPWLDEADRFLGYARAERLPTAKSWSMHHDYQAGVDRLVRAAYVLGWTHPAILKRRTSAAAIQKRWNAALITIGKPPLGLLPP